MLSKLTTKIYTKTKVLIRWVSFRRMLCWLFSILVFFLIMFFSRTRTNSITLSARTDHLVLHKNSIHDKIQYPSPVTNCDAIYTRKSNAKQHVNSFRHDVRYPCSYWRLWFNDHPEAHVKQHVANVHNNVRFPCPAEGCDAMFTQKGHAKQHVDNVDNKVRYSCPVNGYGSCSPWKEVWNNMWIVSTTMLDIYVQLKVVRECHPERSCETTRG